MKILYLTLVSVLVVLNISAGLAKLVQIPQEMEFLQRFGFSELTVIAFGVLQLVSGLLLISPQSRKYGAYIALFAFAFSSILIFSTGAVTFGLVSLLPVVLSVYIAKKAKTFRGY